MSRDIIPIAIFDGPTRKQKKVVKKREQDRQDRKAELDRLKEAVRGATARGHLPDPKDVKKLEEKWQYNFHITKTESDLLYNILCNLGFACMKAKHDAEELCAVLCMEGFVEAVMSTDQDCMVFGAPLVIVEMKPEIVKNPQGGGATECYKVVDLRNTLDVLGLTFDQFVDMCILGKCDFNDNIPGFAIKKAHAFLSKGKTIQDVYNKFKDQFHLLEYKECKEIFTLKVWEQTCTSDLRLVASPDIARKCGYSTLEPYSKKDLDSQGLQGLVDSIIALFKKLPEPRRSACRTPYKLPLTVQK